MLDLVETLTRNAALGLIRPRDGELKLAQTADFCEDGEPWRAALERTSAPVVVLGIPSDIGVRANFGATGCAGLCAVARAKLLSMQDNPSLRGASMLVLGDIAVKDLMDRSRALDPARESDLAQLHGLVSAVDERVAEVVKEVVERGKLLVAVGGGHENAYGILKGLSQATNETVSCVNIDAHADLRADVGRHSGNAFSCARREKFLQRYVVAGVQEPFINEAMWDQLSDGKEVRSITLESMRTRIHSVSQLLRKFPRVWPHAPHLEASEEARKFARKGPLALELDLDSITGIPASAPAAAGLSVNEAREMLRYIATASRRPVRTFHICEGIVDGSDPHGVGALTALLMSDVIKAVLARPAE